MHFPCESSFRTPLLDRRYTGRTLRIERKTAVKANLTVRIAARILEGLLVITRFGIVCIKSYSFSRKERSVESLKLL